VIAYVYHWSWDQILNLSDSERNFFYDSIMQQKKAEYDAINRK